MSNINRWLHQSKQLVSRNASTILTCVGAVGVVATTVMAVKATPKALELLREAEEEKGVELTKVEKVVVAGPAYVPAFVVGASTIACIFGANILNKRQQAALMSAYAVLNSSFNEYKGKLKELYGEEADLQIREAIAKDHYDESIEVGDNKQLFYDSLSQRYFESTIEAVQQAEYRLNHDLNAFSEVTANQWYELLGLEPTLEGEILGWSAGLCFECYYKSWVDFTHHKTVMDDGLECTIIEMMNEPDTEYINW